MPAANPGGEWAYWEKLTDSSAGLAERLGDLATPDARWRTLGYLVGAVAGALAFSPLTLIALPTLIWRFASTNEAYWGTEWHYSMILMPIIFAAAIHALGRWPGARGRPHPHGARAGTEPAGRHPSGTTPPSGAPTGTESAGRSAGGRLRRFYARWAPAAALVFALVTTPFLPLGGLVRPDRPADAQRVEAARTVLALIPPGSSVATDSGLIAYLVADRTVYWLGQDLGGIVPEYVLLDITAGWRNDPGDPATLAEAAYGGHYVTIYPSMRPADNSLFRVARRQAG
jgi:hypothetical protein